jgi:hypothetical protein
LITYLISDFGIASILNHTITFNLVAKSMVWFNMEAIPKFDISIKQTTYMDRAIVSCCLVCRIGLNWLMGCLGTASTVDSVASQISQEGIECVEAKEYLSSV